MWAWHRSLRAKSFLLLLEISGSEIQATPSNQVPDGAAQGKRCVLRAPAASWNLQLRAEAKEAASQLPGGRRPGAGGRGQEAGLAREGDRLLDARAHRSRSWQGGAAKSHSSHGQRRPGKGLAPLLCVQILSLFSEPRGEGAQCLPEPEPALFSALMTVSSRQEASGDGSGAGLCRSLSRPGSGFASVRAAAASAGGLVGPPQGTSRGLSASDLTFPPGGWTLVEPPTCPR